MSIGHQPRRPRTEARTKRHTLLNYYCTVLFVLRAARSKYAFARPHRVDVHLLPLHGDIHIGQEALYPVSLEILFTLCSPRSKILSLASVDRDNKHKKMWPTTSTKCRRNIVQHILASEFIDCGGAGNVTDLGGEPCTLVCWVDYCVFVVFPCVRVSASVGNSGLNKLIVF